MYKVCLLVLFFVLATSGSVFAQENENTTEEQKESNTCVVTLVEQEDIIRDLDDIFYIPVAMRVKLGEEVLYAYTSMDQLVLVGIDHKLHETEARVKLLEHELTVRDAELDTERNKTAQAEEEIKKLKKKDKDKAGVVEQKFLTWKEESRLLKKRSRAFKALFIISSAVVVGLAAGAAITYVADKD